MLVDILMAFLTDGISQWRVLLENPVKSSSPRASGSPVCIEHLIYVLRCELGRKTTTL